MVRNYAVSILSLTKRSKILQLSFIHENLHFHVSIELTFKLKSKRKIVQKAKDVAFDYNKGNWPLFKQICTENLEHGLENESLEETAHRIVDYNKDAADKAISKKRTNPNVSLTYRPL